MCVGWRGTETHAPIPLARHMRHLNDVAPLLGRECYSRGVAYMYCSLFGVALAKRV